MKNNEIENKIRQLEMRLNVLKNERKKELEELAAISDSFDIEDLKNALSGKVSSIQNKIDMEFANIHYELKNLNLNLEDINRKIRELENKSNKKPIFIE